MEALAAFDLVEDALADFQVPEPAPELASRREAKAAKEAAQKAARRAARQPAAVRPAPAPKPGAHYFTSAPPLAEGQAKGVRVRAAGADLVLQAGAGTFSKSELDEGTEILLDTFAQSPAFVQDTPRWCDLGCGWGAVSSVLATQKPEAQLWACDINRRAVALARSNARDLGHSIAAWNGDGLSAARSDFFDAILCNPPVRAGNRVIERLFDDSLRCLRAGGELWIVLRTAQGAKSWQKKLEALFGNCDTVQISHGYRILRCRKAA
jgi:16S rRNA (guanine1207-N2)-methyltransferase